MHLRSLVIRGSVVAALLGFLSHGRIASAQARYPAASTPPASYAYGVGAYGPPPYGYWSYPAGVSPSYTPYPYAPPPNDSATVKPDASGHRITAIVSVLHPLVFSIYDASLEFRAGKRAGIAILGGYGSVPLRMFDDGLPDERAKVYAAGAQLRFFPIGTFEHGLLLGLDTVYLQGSATASLPSESGNPELAVAAKGSGFKVGPFTGYKVILPAGLTLDAEVGIEYLSVRAFLTDGAGVSKTAVLKMPFLLVNGGAGWSF